MSLQGLRGGLLGGSILLDLEIVYPVDGESVIPTGRLMASDLCSSPGGHAGLGRWLEELTGIPGLPTQLGLNAKLESDKRGALAGPITLLNPRSKVDLGVQVSSTGALDGTQLAATLELSDLSQLLGFGDWSLVGRGGLRLEAQVAGGGKHLNADLQLQADQLRVAVCGPGVDLPLTLTALGASMNVSQTETVLSTLSAGIAEGTISCEGRRDEAVGFEGSLKVRDLEIAAPSCLQREACGLMDHRKVGLNLRPKKEARVQLHRSRPLQAHRCKLQSAGTTGSEDQEVWPFPAFTSARPSLSMATWPSKEIGARFRTCELLPRAVRSRQRRTSVRHVTADGTITIPEAYLSESDLLRIPASLVGDVSVPFEVQGPIKSPNVKADVMGALDGIMKKSAVGESLRRVSPALDEWMGATKSSNPTTKSPRGVPSGAQLSDLDVDELIDRIAGGSRDHDACLDELIERGLSPDDIADRIDEAEERLR